MTQEEKAKAYDEALKKAKKRVTTEPQDHTDAILKDIFPQLRESEDERIRKLLVWQVYRNIEDETNDLAGSVYDGIKGHDPDLEESIEDWKKCLAYLEKQKEQKPAQSEEEKEYVRTLKGLVSDFIRDSGGGITDVEYYQNIYDWLDGRHIEQKPAEWDDYTKTNLGRAIQIIKDARGTLHGYQTDDGIYECDKAIEALEHFLYRGLEIEKSADWSEEDEEMLNSCISSIEESKENRYAYKENDGDTSYDREIAWLKSLRPQSKDEIYKEKDEAFKLGKHQLAIKFMNYLDENRPKDKMSLSNSECEDIDKAFKENDWAKILRYAEKYGKKN